MATRADLNTYLRATDRIRRVTARDLARWWAAANFATPEAARDGLLAVTAALVARYGPAAESVAAEWWETLRDRSAPGGSAGAVLGDLDSLTAVTVARVRADAAGALWTATPDRAVVTATQLVGWAVGQAGRNTIVESTVRDPADARWARVPSGAATCAWCLMLASRGAVYLSDDSARGFHPDCDCVPTPVWPGDGLPRGYDPDRLYGMYSEAANAIGTTDPKRVAAELRRMFPSQVTDGVVVTL